MPSASEAGAVGEWLDAVLAARPEFAAPLEGISASVEPIDALPERDPAGWGVLTAAIVAAYYMNPDVCARVGYAGQRAIPFDRGRARLRGSPGVRQGRAGRCIVRRLEVPRRRSGPPVRRGPALL